MDRITADEARSSAQCCTEDDAGDEARRKLLAFIDQAERDGNDLARIPIAELMTHKMLLVERDELRAERVKRVSVGGQMATLMYNLAQRADNEHRDVMDQLRKEWDAIK